MNNLRGRVRIVFALAIAVANFALFATSSSAAPKGCYTCVMVPGGTTGQVPECQFGDTGQMSLCRERLVDCEGYACITGELATEMEFEAVATPVN